MALVTEQRSARRSRVTYPVGLLGLVAALLVALLIAPGHASAATACSTPSTVYQNTMTQGDGTRTPDIASTSANNAVVVWREGTTASVVTDDPSKAVVDHGYIRYAHTEDGGATWSRPQTLAQETSEYSWHYVELYKTGNRVIAYLGRTATTQRVGLPINAIVAKESTDGGLTWHDFPVHFPLGDEADPAAGGLVNLALAGHPVQLANGKYAMPYWSSGRHNGALYSDDLQTWVAGPAAFDPTEYKAGEPQLVVSQEDPPTLLMVARSTPPTLGTPSFALTATAAGTDPGASWGDFALDPNLPNNDSKGYFTKDSTGRYLTIYNADPQRQGLNYRTKRPDPAVWSTSKPFANPDGPNDPTPSGTGAGWDTYPMADEYAPGKYFVVWEHDTSAILTCHLDISGA